MTTTPPVISTTSLPARRPAPVAEPVPAAPPAAAEHGDDGSRLARDAAAAEPGPAARRGRRPAPAVAAARAGATIEPDPELLVELGRLFWTSALEGGSPEDAARRVVEKLRAAKRLGELATLLGVE